MTTFWSAAPPMDEEPAETCSATWRCGCNECVDVGIEAEKEARNLGDEPESVPRGRGRYP